MPFNIASFSSNIRAYGTAQTNRFEVWITMPPILFGDFDFSASDLLRFRASAVSLPGAMTELDVSRRYGVGPIVKTPVNVNFSDISLTLLDTQDNAIWKFFYLWLNKCFGFSGAGSSRSGTYSSDYKQNIASPQVTIVVYDNEGNISMMVGLKECFPVALQEIDLDWQNQNQLFQVKVNLTFKEWFEESVDTLSNPIPSFNTTFPPIFF